MSWREGKAKSRCQTRRGRREVEGRREEGGRCNVEKKQATYDKADGSGEENVEEEVHYALDLAHPGLLELVDRAEA